MDFAPETFLLQSSITHSLNGFVATGVGVGTGALDRFLDTNRPCVHSPQ